MEYQWPIIVRQGKNQYGRRLYYVLNYSEEEQNIRCIWEEVKDLLTGKTFREGEEAVIGDWDLMIFEEIRKKM